MWKLTSIVIKNIVSLKDVAYYPEQNVATLIFGRNEDNLSQPNNGSGKSSLVEAISFALTGEQLRKVKSIEEIINDSANEASVRLRLDNDYDGSSLFIERTISRGAPQRIVCQKFNSLGEEIEKDKMVQPTVADYNKLILSEIGLSKDDIYNNYILCDNKYESFFDASDKNKKEIINRFTNGVIVDESIEKLQNDMIPVQKKLDDANDEFIKISGKISAIQEELDHADEKEADKQRQLQERVERIEGQILKCRENIFETEKSRKRSSEEVSYAGYVEDELSRLKADKKSSLTDLYTEIKDLFWENLPTVELNNYQAFSEDLNAQIQNRKKDIKALQDEILKFDEPFKKRKREFEEAKAVLETETENFNKVFEKKTKAKESLVEEVNKMCDGLDFIEQEIKKSKRETESLASKIAEANVLLAGVVECPKCHNRFFVAGEESVEEIEERIKSLNKELDNAKDSKAKLENQFKELDKETTLKEDELKVLEAELKSNRNKFDSMEEHVRYLRNLFEETEREWRKCEGTLSLEMIDLEKLYSKVDNLRSKLFDEAERKVEEYIASQKRFIERDDDNITYLQGQISQYQQSLKQLEEEPQIDFKSSLKASLERYEQELKKAESKKREIQAEYDTLKEQELNFVLFKSYLARKKIDALSLIVNDFLVKIGSDIRLKLEGYSVTKTGKLRDKISVQVMRDGIDCGSYQKFSGGERARLNLACILSLHTLTNNNCEEGKGLDFIIIDELLDKSDEVGMSTYCDALNKLGQTALLITQGAVSEGYPHRLLITKRQGVSTISD